MADKDLSSPDVSATDDAGKAPAVSPVVPPAPAVIAPPPVALPTCTTCKGKLEVYAGNAAHKLGSAFCHVCGIRTPYKG